jgi:acyl-CoA synthetase (AMP-forming)/AMP-acid ligase II
MRDPERPALTIDDEMILHGELDRLAARAGGWLRAQGIDPENRVLLCGRNSLAFVVAYLGILRAGAIVVPADVGLTESELRYIVEDSDAACALAQGEALDPRRTVF